MLPGEGPHVLVRQALDRAQIVRHGRLLPSPRARTARGPEPYGHGPGSGLDELVLPKRFVAGDGEVAVLVLAVAAAAQLEPGGDLVDRPAAFRRDRPAGHVDGEVDVPPVAAFPVPDLEYRRVGQNVREVEVFALPDRREADVEAPVAADALPEPTLQVHAEPDLEGVLALDDLVILVLVVDVDDVGVPVGPQMPGGQLDLGGTVEPV